MAVREQGGSVGGEEAIRLIALGDWHAAHELLASLAAQRQLSDPELELAARAAYGAGHLEASLVARDRLHERRLAAGDQVGAAAVAAEVAVYLMMDTGLMAPVRGWCTRAERLLEGADECGVHAWLAMVRTYERLMSGDMAAARTWAEQAIAIGARHGEAAPAAIGRVAVARLLIFDGAVDEGLSQLDDAAVTILSGDLDPLTVGMIYCELVCAMQGLAQYDRAREWTEAMERWRHGQAFGGINGRCRVHRAEILRLRGSCAEAEDEALLACEELRPWMRREFGWPLTELGVIRLRRGDLAGAEEALLAAHENGWDPHPGLALLHLSRGQVSVAAALIANALARPRNVPSKERPPYGGLRRAPLLEAQAEIAVAGGDLAVAVVAAEELSAIADGFQSRGLVASAAATWGRVFLAQGEPEAAAERCEEAVGIWSDIGAPFETAVARLGLAEAHHAIGNRERALLEASAARGALERIGATLAAEEAARLVAVLAGAGEADGGARAAPAAPPHRSAVAARVADHVFRVEGDTRSVVFGGKAILLRDLKGLRYLARLLAQPGRELHVLDLVTMEHGSSAAASGLGPLLDDQARETLRVRLHEIEADLDEAAVTGDAERAALAEADREYIVAELSRAFGLGGRNRDPASSSERARASVTRAIRYALDRLAAHHPPLAEHLDATVRTGTYCVYAPDPRVPIEWEV